MIDPPDIRTLPEDYQNILPDTILSEFNLIEPQLFWPLKDFNRTFTGTLPETILPELYMNLTENSEVI